MAPISSLDQDTLGIIFDDVYTQQGLMPGLNLRSAPLNLSRTCRRWHEILLTSPRFWRDIECRSLEDLKLAPLWLQGSGDAVIDVKIWNINIMCKDETLLRDVLLMVLNNQSRLRKLCLCGVDMGKFAPVTMENFANLVELDLGMYKDAPYTFLLPPTHQQPIAPMLCKITICSRTTRRGKQEIWSLLKQCPNLKELSLYVRECGTIEDDKPTDDILVLEKLGSINFEGSFCDGSAREYFRPLLQRLKAPSLRSLAIKVKMDEPLVDATRQFLQRSHCGASVRHAYFYFEVSSCSEHVQEKLFETLPGLEELHIAVHEERTYRVLTLGGGSGSLCPQLEYVKTYGSPCRSCNALADFVVSRLRQPKLFTAETRVDYLEEAQSRWLSMHSALRRSMVNYDSKYIVWSNEEFEDSDGTEFS